jgi:hypothetical protein
LEDRKRACSAGSSIAEFNMELKKIDFTGPKT